MISEAPLCLCSGRQAFVLRLSKDERRVFQQNQYHGLTPVTGVIKEVI